MILFWLICNQSNQIIRCNDIFTMTVSDSSLKTRHVADIEPEAQNLFLAGFLGEVQFFPIGISATDYIRDVIPTRIMSMV